MQTRVVEIAENIFSITLAPEKVPVSFNHFLIRDERPTLIHTGDLQGFETLKQEVSRLVNPAEIANLAFSHYEPDECGSLLQWLEVAPKAEVRIGKICHISVRAVIPPEVREIQPMAHLQTVDLGCHQLQLLETPHFPHNWDACLFYEPVTKTLFSSDLGIQPGFPDALATRDLTEEILYFQKVMHYMPYGPYFLQGLETLKALDIELMAVMHGSSLNREMTQNLFRRLEQEATGALLAEPVGVA